MRKDLYAKEIEQSVVLAQRAVMSDEEELVADARGSRTPAQSVEDKLVGVLRSGPLLVSHMQRPSVMRRR